MTTRPMKLLPMSLLVLALAVIGCTSHSDPRANLGWPRIGVSEQYRHHGDYGGWTIDAQGNYVVGTKGSPDGSSSTFTTCTGTLPREQFEPWFREIEQWTLIPEPTHPRRDPDHDGPRLSYMVTEGKRLIPTDDATREARRELARRIFDAMPERDETCTKETKRY